MLSGCFCFVAEGWVKIDQIGDGGGYGVRCTTFYARMCRPRFSTVRRRKSDCLIPSFGPAE